MTTSPSELSATVSVSRKVNLGNYESGDVFLSVSNITMTTTAAEISDLLAGSAAMAYELVKAAVETRVAALKSPAAPAATNGKRQSKWREKKRDPKPLHMTRWFAILNTLVEYGQLPALLAMTNDSDAAKGARSALLAACLGMPESWVPEVEKLSAEDWKRAADALSDRRDQRLNLEPPPPDEVPA